MNFSFCFQFLYISVSLTYSLQQCCLNHLPVSCTTPLVPPLILLSLCFLLPRYPALNLFLFFFIISHLFFSIYPAAVSSHCCFTPFLPPTPSPRLFLFILTSNSPPLTCHRHNLLLAYSLPSPLSLLCLHSFSHVHPFSITHTPISWCECLLSHLVILHTWHPAVCVHVFVYFYRV